MDAVCALETTAQQSTAEHLLLSPNTWTNLVEIWICSWRKLLHLWQIVPGWSRHTQPHCAFLLTLWLLIGRGWLQDPYWEIWESQEQFPLIPFYDATQSGYKPPCVQSRNNEMLRRRNPPFDFAFKLSEGIPGPLRTHHVYFPAMYAPEWDWSPAIPVTQRHFFGYTLCPSKGSSPAQPAQTLALQSHHSFTQSSPLPSASWVTSVNCPLSWKSKVFIAACDVWRRKNAALFSELSPHIILGTRTQKDPDVVSDLQQGDLENQQWRVK